MPKLSTAAEVFSGIVPHLEGRRFEPHEAAKLVSLISAKLRERTHSHPHQAEPLARDSGATTGPAPSTPEHTLLLQNLTTQLKIHHERLTVLERSLASNKPTDH